MLPPSIHKHKAVWASSIAIITLGAVVYFTVYRNSKEPSKPSKKPIQDREVVHKEKHVDNLKVEEKKEESIKSRDISNQVDVSQVKATVTLEQEKTDSNQITSDDKANNTETEKEIIKEEVKEEVKKEKEIEKEIATTETIQKDNNNIDTVLKESTESIVQVNENDQLNESFVLVNDTKTETTTTDASSNNNESSIIEENIEKSPLLTAAPSSSSSSDISSQPDQESKVVEKVVKDEKLQEENKKKDTGKLNNNNVNPTATATTLNNSTTAPSLRSTSNHQHHHHQYPNNNNMMNVNNTNGMYINGYWHAPTATTTFQHSMGWPELFPLQQQQNQQNQHQQDNKNNNYQKKQQQQLLDENDPAALKKYQQKEKKRNNKKKMTRLEQIDQQRQNYVPTMKSRCNWWPNCTNKNCKYFHPHQPCRYGDLCIYNERCMFLHPWDYEESYK